MKKQNCVIYPSFESIKRPLSWIGLICILLSSGSLLCVAGASRGIDWHAFKVFLGIPFGFILTPILIIFLSCKIKRTDDKITFYLFYLPVKTIPLKEIRWVKFDKIASTGQPCAITIDYNNKKYIYPVRLFKESDIEELINELNNGIAVNVKSKNHTDALQSSIFDFSKSEIRTNFVRYIVMLLMILLFILLSGKIKLGGVAGYASSVFSSAYHSLTPNGRPE